MINVIPAGSEELPWFDRNTTFLIYDKTSWNEMKLFLTSRYLYFFHLFSGSQLAYSHLLAAAWRSQQLVSMSTITLADRAANEPSVKFSQSRRRPLLGAFNQEKAQVRTFSVIVKTLPMVRLQLYQPTWLWTWTPTTGIWDLQAAANKCEYASCEPENKWKK